MSVPEIITFGCRLNAYESEVIRGQAQTAGLGDAIIVNTCAVTAEAERQARQAIRRARRDHPRARIIVTGCAAQIAPDQFASMPEVDHVLGNDEKMKVQAWSALQREDAARITVNDIMSVRETAPHMIDGLAGRARAFVQIQNGCDHRCTFCIIPFGRGPSRSAPAHEIINQVRRIVETGTNEVVLTGVDLTGYGADLADAMSLGQLTRTILADVPALARLRLSSIDTIEADDALMTAIAEEQRLMPHFHLSLQSGDDLVLKRMKRRHARQDSIEFCQSVRALRPDAVFGADIIAGFPTETEQMFANTLDLVDECGLTFLHVFPFSPRPGTPAAHMPQLARETVKARAARLREKGAAALESHLEAQKGRTHAVLMEDETRGRTAQFTPIHMDAAYLPGTIIKAAVTGHDGQALTGAARP